MIIASNHKFYFSWYYTKRKEIARSKCLKSKDCLLMLIKTNKIDLPKYYNDWTWHWKKILFWINQKVSHHLAAIIIEITYIHSIQHDGLFRIPYLLKIKYYVRDLPVLFMNCSLSIHLLWARVLCVHFFLSSVQRVLT